MNSIYIITNEPYIFSKFLSVPDKYNVVYVMSKNGYIYLHNTLDKMNGNDYSMAKFRDRIGRFIENKEPVVFIHHTDKINNIILQRCRTAYSLDLIKEIEYEYSVHVKTIKDHEAHIEDYISKTSLTINEYGKIEKKYMNGKKVIETLLTIVPIELQNELLSIDTSLGDKEIGNALYSFYHKTISSEDYPINEEWKIDLMRIFTGMSTRIMIKNKMIGSVINHIANDLTEDI